MLNREMLFHAIKEVEDKIFYDTTPVIQQAKQIWHHLCTDKTIVNGIRTMNSSYIIPDWLGKIDEAVTIGQVSSPSYAIVSIDGSQIYPDRHEGTACYLINIGSVFLQYGTAAQAHLRSIPHVFAQQDQDFDETVERINCQRQELEFKAFGDVIEQYLNDEQKSPFLCLCDGSLIFWHLQAKDASLREFFLRKYLNSMHLLHQKKVPLIGYISMPKSKELLNVLRRAALWCGYHDFLSSCDSIVDSTIASFYLKPYQRTALFSSNTAIVKHYPQELWPHFCYVHVGHEVVRIELPQWLVNDIDDILPLIIDQVHKGHGYPIAIAEAHEQAVIKGMDREFFYHLIKKLGLQSQNKISISQKLKKKRFIGV